MPARVISSHRVSRVYRGLGHAHDGAHSSEQARGVVIRMLDHTADVGFEVEASTLASLFDETRRALLLTIFEKPPQRGEDEHPVRLSAPDLETLIVRWTNELVYMVQDLGAVPVNGEVRIDGPGEGGCSVSARLATAPLDLDAYGWRGEIKSATFHGLQVRREGERWRARMILDV